MVYMSKEINTRTLLGQSLLIVLLWLGWVLLMRLLPEPFANVYLRGLFRISILLVPAYLFLRKSGTSWLDRWYLRVNWRRGVFVGLVVAALFLSFSYFVQSREVELVWHLPVKVDTWFNWIIGSPFAEEVWFRAVLFNEIKRKHGLFYALLGSSLMFGLLHLPTWIILDGMSGVLLVQSFGNIFLYGFVFALLFRATGSLWASLVPHWLNNLFVQGFLR
jgi:membrane protease YdiL (CAAX protease family)